MKNITLLLLISIYASNSYLFAQSKDSIKILILYGSKPKKKGNTYKAVLNCYGEEPCNKCPQREMDWSMGRFGGHISLEIEDDSVLSFQPKQYNFLNYFKNNNSFFKIETECEMWESYYDATRDYPISDLKRMIITIPITKDDKQKIKEIATQYRHITPYNYKFFGMRCGSATYEILSQLGLITVHEHHKWTHAFTPRHFRYLLLKKIKCEQVPWRVYKSDGTTRRKWAGDKKIKCN